jgi:hypothetical protein
MTFFYCAIAVGGPESVILREENLDLVDETLIWIKL